VSKYRHTTGRVLMILVAVIMLLAGSGKLFGFAPEMVVEQLEGAE